MSTKTLKYYYAYILQSEVDQSFYKGSTEDYLKRLEQHNQGLSHYTSRKMPWKLVCVERFESRAEAMSREKSLKKAGGSRLQTIIDSSKNILKKSG